QGEIGEIILFEKECVEVTQSRRQGTLVQRIVGDIEDSQFGQALREAERGELVAEQIEDIKVGQGVRDGKVLMALLSRSRMCRFWAASKPVTFVIPCPPANRFVRLSRSGAVNGPAGFCSVLRMTASSAGSGMEMVWARAGATQMVTKAKANKMSREF